MICSSIRMNKLQTFYIYAISFFFTLKFKRISVRLIGEHCAQTLFISFRLFGSQCNLIKLLRLLIKIATFDLVRCSFSFELNFLMANTLFFQFAFRCTCGFFYWKLSIIEFLFWTIFGNILGLNLAVSNQKNICNFFLLILYCFGSEKG